MRYHFVLNGYLQNCQKLMQEMKSFKETYLSGAEEGVTYLYCQSEETARKLNGRLTENASVLIAKEYVPEVVLKLLEELSENRTKEKNCQTQNKELEEKEALLVKQQEEQQWEQKLQQEEQLLHQENLHLVQN